MRTKLPKWDFSNSYVDIDHEKFIDAFLDLSDRVKTFATHKDFSKQRLSPLLKEYEGCKDLCSSLNNFLHCLAALDAHDPRIEPKHAQILALSLELELLSQPLFEHLSALKNDDALWKDPVLAPWKYSISLRKKSYLNALRLEDKEIFLNLANVSFYPLTNNYNNINKLIDFEIQGRLGKEHVGIAKLTGLLKGSGTHSMRKQAYEKSCEFYDMHSSLYADTLNAIHGFNIARINAAGVDILQPALDENRISKAALDAMFASIQKHKKRLRDAVILRAPYVNIMAGNKRLKKMPVYDLNSPAPSLEQYRAKKAGKSNLIVKNDTIPYSKALSLMKEAFSSLDPKVGEFVDYMHSNGLVEARISDKKIGGAFTEKIDSFHEQRIFASYMGSFSSLITQAHELGLAWYYHLLEDLPTVLSEVPTTIATSASIFTESLIRDHVKQKRGEQLRFSMLWQELKAAENLLLHLPTRFDFELSFIQERSSSCVTAIRACELMEAAWEKWYGASTIGAETYMWCFKHHFYMTNEYFYNFPYTVGYLISQNLRLQKETGDKNFFKSLESFFKDSAKMSVDDLVKKHLGFDITKPDFWEEGLSKSIKDIDEFEKTYKP